MNNENVNTIEELKIIEKKLPTSPDELYKFKKSTPPRI